MDKLLSVLSRTMVADVAAIKFTWLPAGFSPSPPTAGAAAKLFEVLPGNGNSVARRSIYGGAGETGEGARWCIVRPLAAARSDMSA